MALTDEQIAQERKAFEAVHPMPEKQRLWNDATYNNRSSTTDAAMEYGSAIEALHGITPVFDKSKTTVEKEGE